LRYFSCIHGKKICLFEFGRKDRFYFWQNQQFIRVKIEGGEDIEMRDILIGKIFHQISKICQKQRGIPLFLR
jgi:hypothetical protein